MVYALQVLKLFSFLLRATCVIFTRVINTDVWQAIVTRYTESRKKNLWQATVKSRQYYYQKGRLLCKLLKAFAFKGTNEQLFLAVAVFRYQSSYFRPLVGNIFLFGTNITWYWHVRIAHLFKSGSIRRDETFVFRVQESILLTLTKLHALKCCDF